MELTLNIKEEKKIASFLNMLKEMDFVEIIDVKEGKEDIPIEHQKLLDERLKKIESGKATFKSWDEIKKKYEDKAL